MQHIPLCTHGTEPAHKATQSCNMLVTLHFEVKGKGAQQRKSYGGEARSRHKGLRPRMRTVRGLSLEHLPVRRGEHRGHEP